MSLPARPATPLAAVTRRMLLAAGLLALSMVIVYWGRFGYRDAAHPGHPLSVLGCVYHATVTLSTTGFGDIVPVTATARLVNTVLIIPNQGDLPYCAGGHHAGGAGRADPDELAGRPVEVAWGWSDGRHRIRDEGPQRDRDTGSVRAAG